MFLRPLAMAVRFFFVHAVSAGDGPASATLSPKVDQAELIEQGERAYALAERWPAQRGFELDPDGWRRLLQVAEQEPEQDSPASAAVWEALWRDDPHLTPTAWVTDGPQPPDGEPLNPFLRAERYSKREATLALTHFDPQAGSLLDAAIRAESVPRWWDTGHLLAQYTTAQVEASQFLHAYSLEGDSGGAPSDGGWGPELSPLDPELPPNRLEDIQVALTRLLLIGHSATTAQILPSLLASIQGEPGTSLVAQTRIVGFAMQRLGVSRRALTGARSAVKAGVPMRLQRVRLDEPAVREPIAVRARTITAILLGTLLGGSQSQRTGRKDSAGSQPTRLNT
jgi:hypothetical protein